MNQSLRESRPKIFIAGDSWGGGEYNNVNGTVTGISHKGIEQYFTNDGYTVNNSSVGGMCNRTAIQRLRLDLETSHKDGDIIFWIQTEAVRDLVIPDPDDKNRVIYPLTNPVQLAGGIINLYRQLSNTRYNELDTLSKQFNTVIYAIGGCGSLFIDDIIKYSNLIPLIPSCVELISGKYPEFQFIGLWGIDSIKLAEYPQQFARHIIDEFDSIVQMEEIFKQPGFINRHPDRHGYKIVYDYIKQELNL